MYSEMPILNPWVVIVELPRLECCAQLLVFREINNDFLLIFFDSYIYFFLVPGLKL